MTADEYIPGSFSNCEFSECRVQCVRVFVRVFTPAAEKLCSIRIQPAASHFHRRRCP